MTKLSSLLLAVVLTLAACPATGWAQGRSIPKGSEAKAQENTGKLLDDILPEGQKYRYPLFNGLSLSVDVFDPLLSLMMLDHCTYEVQAMVDLHHRFFPMAAMGMGWADEQSDNGLDFGTDQKQELRFKSDLAPFAKVGMAYNLNFNDTRPSDFYLVMMRYGLAWNKADISNLYYANETWGALGPIDIKDQEYTTHWLEVGGMIKVQVWNRISMGWDLYWKIRLAQSGTKLGDAYYVPGMGTSQSNVGFSFRIYYDLF